jgi:glycosyltransferase involved in cell wall biosynthesis
MTEKVLKASITLLMPVKNEIQFISRALSQMVDNMSVGDEIIVVDDGSIDGTWEFLQDYAKQSRKLTLLKNPGKGIVDALNFGVQNSNNQWIARFDADDLYPNNRLTLQRELCTEDVGVIFSDYSFRSLSGQNLGQIKSAVSMTQTTISLISGQRTAHPSAIINKVAFEMAGGYRQIDFPAEDLSLWLRISQDFNLATYPRDLLSYTLRAGSITNLNRMCSLKKRRELLSEFKIKESVISNLINNFQQELMDISKGPDSAERTILFLRDIHILAKMKYLPIHVSFKFEAIILKKLVTDLNFYVALINLIYFRIQRRKLKF